MEETSRELDTNERLSLFLKDPAKDDDGLDSVTVCRKMSVCNAGHGMGWDGTSIRLPQSLLSQCAREMSGIIV